MKYGFIGCGNMGSALAKTVCKSVDSKDVMLSSRTMEKAQLLAKKLNCTFGSNKQVAENCDFIFLGVKPQMLDALLTELVPTFKQRYTSRPFTLVSMVSGISISQIQEMLENDYPIIRIMPNTAVAVEEGMIQYCYKNVDKNSLDSWLNAMSKAGHLDEIDEQLIDVASALSGCGPAWAYQFIEALADGAVSLGLSRDKSIEYASQMLLGAAKMVLETKKHPAQLKDEVCSPKGSTIQGVRILEENGFRGIVIDAVIAAYEKTKKLGEK